MENAKTVRENTAAIVADGLKLTLWASDSLAPDPIAMSVDNEGAIYLTRTNRQKHSEFDIRGYRDWMTASISLQSVEDRRAFLHETFAPEKSDENSWLKVNLINAYVFLKYKFGVHPKKLRKSYKNLLRESV